jgi:transcriptional regulator with XRE-family HTH domain
MLWYSYVMVNELGERLLELRNALDLTQEEFALRIKFSTGYITSLENSHRKLNPRIIKLITDTFGVNEQWLQTGNGDMFTNHKDVSLNEVISLYKQLHPKLQKLVIEQLKVLLEMNKIPKDDE